MNMQDILFILVNILPFIFLGCVIASVYAREEVKELDVAEIEADVIVHIKDDLFYDPDTFIVYRDIPYSYKNDSVLVHYYSPAGYEYRYNPETKEFKEIKNDRNNKE